MTDLKEIPQNDYATVTLELRFVAPETAAEAKAIIDKAFGAVTSNDGPSPVWVRVNIKGLPDEIASVAQQAIDEAKAGIAATRPRPRAVVKASKDKETR